MLIQSKQATMTMIRAVAVIVLALLLGSTTSTSATTSISPSSSKLSSSSKLFMDNGSKPLRVSSSTTAPNLSSTHHRASSNEGSPKIRKKSKTHHDSSGKQTTSDGETWTVAHAHHKSSKGSHLLMHPNTKDDTTEASNSLSVTRSLTLCNDTSSAASLAPSAHASPKLGSSKKGKSGRVVSSSSEGSTTSTSHSEPSSIQSSSKSSSSGSRTVPSTAHPSTLAPFLSLSPTSTSANPTFELFSNTSTTSSNSDTVNNCVMLCYSADKNNGVISLKQVEPTSGGYKVPRRISGVMLMAMVTTTWFAVIY